MDTEKIGGKMYRTTRKGREVECETPRLRLFGLDSDEDGTTLVGIEMAHDRGTVALLMRPDNADAVAKVLRDYANAAREREEAARTEQVLAKQAEQDRVKKQAEEAAAKLTVDAANVIEAAEKVIRGSQEMFGGGDYIVQGAHWSGLVRALQAYKPGWGRERGIR
jgi:hypothetical protein